MRNDYLRSKVRNFIRENGIKHSFIAKELEISEAMLSMFLSKKRELGDKNKCKLINFLQEKGAI